MNTVTICLDRNTTHYTKSKKSVLGEDHQSGKAARQLFNRSTAQAMLFQVSSSLKAAWLWHPHVIPLLHIPRKHPFFTGKCVVGGNTFSQAPLVWWKGLHRAGTPSSSDATCCPRRPNEQKLPGICFCRGYTCIALEVLRVHTPNPLESPQAQNILKPAYFIACDFCNLQIHLLLRNGGWISAAIRGRTRISTNVCSLEGPNPLDESTLGPRDRCGVMPRYSIKWYKMV